MTVAITATVLTGDDPAPVQVVVTGMSSGDPYIVQGAYGGRTWAIPAGIGTSDGSTLILIDNRAPFNGPVAYTVWVDNSPTTSNTVQVDYDGVCALQALAGMPIVKVEVATQADERAQDARASIYQIAGRADPVGRYDKPLLASMDLPVETETADTLALEELLNLGGPIIRRNDVSVTGRGIPPVEILLVRNWSSRLIGAVGNTRAWSLAAQVIGDPEPGVVLVAFDWDDFDSIYAGSTWTDFDAEWSGLTWADFDLFDWGTRL